MDHRQKFKEYVKNGGEQFCSPQIGAGAGFDTKLSGKEWISETTLEDTLAAVGRFNIVPLINVGFPLEACSGDTVWEETYVERDQDKIVRKYRMTTPVGTLTREACEVRKSSAFHLKEAVTGEEDLDAFEYYLDRVMESDCGRAEQWIRDMVSIIGGRAALSVQWPVQPYELFCFPNTVDTVLLAHDCPERFKLLMDKIVRIDEKLMHAASAGGADFIFLGAPASEMLSPAYYEKLIIPYSQTVTSMAHSMGLMVYSHICSPIEPFLSMGYYNRMGIDLFETLSPPPVGNIKSLEDALDKIDPQICTRGNLGLDVLLHSTPEEIKRQACEIRRVTEDRKHILAASDYLFYEVPEENVYAIGEVFK